MNYDITDTISSKYVPGNTALPYVGWTHNLLNPL